LQVFQKGRKQRALNFCSYIFAKANCTAAAFRDLLFLAYIDSSFPTGTKAVAVKTVSFSDNWSPLSFGCQAPNSIFIIPRNLGHISQFTLQTIAATHAATGNPKFR
jgi:hypothetical protein